jgi:hypothetical protein
LEVEVLVEVAVVVIPMVEVGRAVLVEFVSFGRVN